MSSLDVTTIYEIKDKPRYINAVCEAYKNDPAFQLDEAHTYSTAIVAIRQNKESCALRQFLFSRLSFIDDIDKEYKLREFNESIDFIKSKGYCKSIIDALEAIIRNNNPTELQDILEDTTPIVWLAIEKALPNRDAFATDFISQLIGDLIHEANPTNPLILPLSIYLKDQGFQKDIDSILVNIFFSINSTCEGVLGVLNNLLNVDPLRNKIWKRLEDFTTQHADLLNNSELVHALTGMHYQPPTQSIDYEKDRTMNVINAIKDAAYLSNLEKIELLQLTSISRETAFHCNYSEQIISYLRAEIPFCIMSNLLAEERYNMLTLTPQVKIKLDIFAILYVNYKKEDTRKYIDEIFDTTLAGIEDCLLHALQKGFSIKCVYAAGVESEHGWDPVLFLENHQFFTDYIESLNIFNEDILYRLLVNADIILCSSDDNLTELLDHCFTVFKKVNINPQTHFNSIQAIINAVKRLPGGIGADDLLSFFEQEYQSNPQIQDDDLTGRINKYKFKEPSFPQGPLPKNICTSIIEDILQDLSRNYDRFTITQNTNHHLIYYGPAQINLSLLLRNSDLSQLELPIELLVRLGLIPEVSKELDHSNIKGQELSLETRRLHAILQSALYYYTSDRYVSLNKIFRSETIQDDLADHDKIKVQFIIGCLVHCAINQLSHAQRASTETNSDTVKLCVRFEDIDYLEHQRRQRGLQRLVALTSFSSKPQGETAFKDSDSTQTVLVGSRYHIEVTTDEQEVLLPHGTVLFTYPTLQPNLLRSTIVRSPALENNQYISDCALVSAYENHLSKPYQDEESWLIINEQKLPRPNHNITNTYRVIQLIENVLEHFASYAKEPEFREYCEQILESPHDIELLKIAAAFRVTGRESEVSFKDNPAQYTRYREASTRNLKTYLDGTRTSAEQKRACTIL